MKIAIHKKEGSFSNIWIKYCERNNIQFKIVNCYGTDIIAQLDGCDGLMWHWDLSDYKAALFARQLTISLERKGIKVFPDINTSWHYDDKVGQKYLLEAVKAPLIRSYVFYSKKDALEWIGQTSFPKVFKLRNGAGSSNVKLIKVRKKAKRLINKAFGKGIAPISSISRLKERLWILKRDKDWIAIKKVVAGIVRIFVLKEIEKFSPVEKGYVYFQDFISQSKLDTRLVVIGNSCFGLIRYCRKGDFRASGSGLKDYNPELIDIECVKIAFDTAQKLEMQSVAFDFIKDKDSFRIIELSYAFVSERFPGYWDTNFTWHEGEVSPQDFMIKNFIESLESANFSKKAVL